MPKVVGRLIVFLTTACIAVLGLGALINIQFGLDNGLLLRAFEVDEDTNLKLVIRSLQSNSLDPSGWYYYGYLYPTVGFALAKFYNFLGDQVLSARFLGALLRLISLTCYLGVIWLMTRLGSLLRLSRPFALGAALFVACVPELYARAQMVAPDLAQVMLLILAVWTAAADHSRRGTVCSALVAGLAFGTKYSGIFFIPFIPVPFLLKEWSDGSNWKEIARRAWPVVLAAVAAFLIGWLAFNPYVPTHFAQFRSVLAWEYGAVGTQGWHGKVAPANPLLWLPVIREQVSPIGMAVVILGIGAMAYYAIGEYRRSVSLRQFFSNPTLRILVMLLTYVAFSICYVALTVRKRDARYLFFIFPFVVTLAFVGLSRLHDSLRPRIQLLTALLPMLLAAVMTTAAVRATSATTLKDESPVAKGADFMLRCYDVRVRVLYEWYSYVPPVFQNQKTDFVVRPELIAEFKPDLIVLSKAMTGLYAWKAPGTHFSAHKYIADSSYGSLAESRLEFVRSLFDSGSRWEVVWEAEEEVILQAKNFAGERRCP